MVFVSPCFCTGALPSPPAVTFSWATFIALFPEFSCMNEPQGQAYFDLAGIYVENSTRNPLWCYGVLPQVMLLVTAHIAWLMAPRDANGNPAQTGTVPGQIVGRINSASQGSVSVGTTLDGEPGSPSEAWYAQTRYGLMAWQAMAVGRSFRYTVSPTLVGGPVFPGAPWLPINFWSPVTFQGGLA